MYGSRCRTHQPLSRRVDLLGPRGIEQPIYALVGTIDRSEFTTCSIQRAMPCHPRHYGLGTAEGTTTNTPRGRDRGPAVRARTHLEFHSHLPLLIGHWVCHRHWVWHSAVWDGVVNRTPPQACRCFDHPSRAGSEWVKVHHFCGVVSHILISTVT